MGRRLSDDGPAGIELAFDELLVNGVVVGELASNGLVRVELATSKHEREDELTDDELAMGEVADGELADGELSWCELAVGELAFGELLWCGLAVDGATSSLLMCLHGWSLLLVSSLL